MQRSPFWAAIYGLLLAFLSLASATGCSQGSAEEGKKPPVPQPKGIRKQATGAETKTAAKDTPLGSPSATTSIPGKQLPPPDPKFGGVIKEKASESKPYWAPRVVPPKGAPNVLLIMTDDCGFGSPNPPAILLMMTHSDAIVRWLSECLLSAPFKNRWNPNADGRSRNCR